MFHTCSSPVDKLHLDENAKFEMRKTEYDIYYEAESTMKWLKICNEGYKFDNGERFVELTCMSNHEWTVTDRSPIPRYYIMKYYTTIIRCYCIGFFHIYTTVSLPYFISNLLR